jgi:hypothetical protein
MTPNPSIERTMSETLPNWRDGAAKAIKQRTDIPMKTTKTTTLNDLSPAEARVIANGGLSGVATLVNASSVGRMGDTPRSLRRPEEKKP